MFSLTPSLFYVQVQLYTVVIRCFPLSPLAHDNLNNKTDMHFSLDILFLFTYKTRRPGSSSRTSFMRSKNSCARFSSPL
jgi:hypothetical protein